MITIVRAVQTSIACPAQWDTWDADGNYYYMRYRGGYGSVRQYAGPDWADGGNAEVITHVAGFAHGHPLDGSIGLAEFCELAGVRLADGLDETGFGQAMTDKLILLGVTEILLAEQDGPS